MTSSKTKSRFNKLPVPLEHHEQVELFAKLAELEPMIPDVGLAFAIPNGGARNIVVATKLKAEGVKAGVPDVCWPVSRGRYTALWVEMKRRKGGRVPPNQKAWHSALEKAGGMVVVAYGAHDAIEAVICYHSLGLPSWYALADRAD